MSGSLVPTAPPAGWYPAPSGQGMWWWDGRRWLEPWHQTAGLSSVRSIYPAAIGSTSGVWIVNHVLLCIGLGRMLLTDAQVDLPRLLVGRSFAASLVFGVAIGLRSEYLAATRANP